MESNLINGVPVTITETFKGQHGQMWTRAKTASGRSIVGHSRLFKKVDENKVIVNPLDLQPALTTGVRKLADLFKS